MDSRQLKQIEKIVSRYRVTDGSKFRLKDVDPDDTAGLDLGEDERRQLLADSTDWLSEEQDRLYAQDRWSVLMILQAMDAAGKDGTIRHVFSGVNPQGCEIHSFKAPNPTELDHDFLWRHMNTLPSRGCIGIHNRSWYEEVLVVRVHPNFLDAQKLPDSVRSKRIFDERLEDIAAVERYLARQGTAILKIYLHVSRKEQKKRFLARIEEPDRNWKFSAADVAERQYWDEYMDAYEQAIRRTAAPHAPWYVIPADNKWFTRLAVAGAMIVTMDALDLAYPKLPKSELAKLQDAKRQLLGERK